MLPVGAVCSPSALRPGICQTSPETMLPSRSPRHPPPPVCRRSTSQYVNHATSTSTLSEWNLIWHTICRFRGAGSFPYGALVCLPPRPPPVYRQDSSGRRSGCGQSRSWSCPDGVQASHLLSPTHPTPPITGRCAPLEGGGGWSKGDGVMWKERSAAANPDSEVIGAVPARACVGRKLHWGQIEPRG